MKECKGCLVNELDIVGHQCIFQGDYKYLYLNCPCRVCLVKGICRNQCEEYNQHGED